MESKIKSARLQEFTRGFGSFGSGQRQTTQVIKLGEGLTARCGLSGAVIFDVSTATSHLLMSHRDAAAIRQTEMIPRLRADVEMVLLGGETREAVLIRGSLARGDFCSQSDVDLVVLRGHGKAKVHRVFHDQAERLERSAGRRISIECWNEKTCKERSCSIGFWLGAFEAKILAGDDDFFALCRLGWLNGLTKIPIPRLFELRRLDLRRHWHIRQRHSALGMNIKRAEGGLIDGDFIKLLRYSGGGCSAKEQELFDKSQLIRDHLFLVKSLLHNITDAPRESALLEDERGDLPRVLSRDNVASLLDSQKRLLEELKEKLQC